MIYRMKQNAVGLANICILSTMVLVMLSSTVSLYIGQEDVLRSRYRKECMLRITTQKEDEEDKVKDLINQVLEEYELRAVEQEEYHYLSVTLYVGQDGVFSKKNIPIEKMCYLTVIPLEDYNKLYQKEVVLTDEEAILVASYNNTLDTITIANKTWNFVEKEQHEEFIDKYMVVDSIILAVNDPDDIKRAFEQLEGDAGWISEKLKYTYGFELDGEKEKIIPFETDLKRVISSFCEENDINWTMDFREVKREEFFSLYGGLFFLGIFLGSLFLMATVLIIYYKQISEGFDDKERFDIMQKVGMSKIEIKKSIQSQIRMVFFLPLLVAIVHIMFAFPVITKLLYVMNLDNIPLFFACTVGTILIFAIIYIVVFFITAKEYYRIVK